VTSLPHDEDAERAVIGALLLNPDAFSDVIDILQPVDFYSPNHEIIYRAEIDLFADGEPVDAITLVDKLTKIGELTKIGGANAIHDIVGGVMSTANIAYYANIVAERALLRRIIRAGTRIEQLGFTTEGADVQNALNIAQEEVYALANNAGASDYVTIKQGLVATREQIELAQSGGGASGVETGLTALDNYLHGLKGGQMVVIAARPGVGKSVLSLDIARYAAIRNRIPTIMFNLEMAYPEILMRLLSAEKSISQENLQNGKLSDEEWQRIEQFERSLVDKEGHEVPLYVDDSANMSMMQIRTKCRRLASTKQGLGLVIVDYLQLMSSNERIENRQQEIAGFSRKLKLLAKELDVPIIAISQLNRGSEMRGDKTPQLSDLRESGAIEQDADVVLLIHREEMYHKDDEDEKARPGEADIIVAKNRAGRTGHIVVSAQMQYSRFRNMAREV
jgi:replicative DNA helicase